MFWNRWVLNNLSRKFLFIDRTDYFLDALPKTGQAFSV